MNRTYEAMIVLDNREVRKGWDELKKSVSGMFTKHGAKVVSARRWDERRLAYPINNQRRGTFLLCYFESDTQALGGIRRDLEYNETVLRHLTLQCDAVPESAFEPEEAFDPASVRIDDEPEVREQPAEAASDDGDAPPRPRRRARATDDDVTSGEVGGDAANSDDTSDDEEVR